MTTLTPAQVAQYAAQAGFKGGGLSKAVAVALAESGGRTDIVATNHDRWKSRDRGLWQINDHWHPEVTDAAAFNPASAAAAAYSISKAGADWSAWSTWKTGAALAQMGRAQLATGSVQNAGHIKIPILPDIPIPGDRDIAPVPSPGEIVGGAKDVLDVYKQGLVLWIHGAAWVANPHNWSRVAMVVGGGYAMLLGLYLLANTGAAGSTAASAAGKVKKTVKASGDAALMVGTGGAGAVAKGAGVAAKAGKASKAASAAKAGAAASAVKSA